MAIQRIAPGSILSTARGHSVRVVAWRGEGSYSRVYEAGLGSPSRQCALKLPKREVPESNAWLLGELEVLSAATHPRLVSMLDHGCADDLPFLVLEWLDGPTLLDLIAERRRLPLRLAVELVEQVTEAVEALHSVGQCHGDIRPQNVLVVPGRGAVLTDPAPSQRLSEDTSNANDVRALGELFHRALTGEDPAKCGPKLVSGAGYNRAAVRLWDRSESPNPPTVGELLGELAALRRSL